MKETGLLNYDLKNGTINEINWSNMERLYTQAVAKRRKGQSLTEAETAGLVGVLVRDYLIDRYLTGEDIETGVLPKM